MKLKLTSKRMTSAFVAFTALTLGSGAVIAQTTVNIGVIGATSDAAFYIADRKGYFKAEGINANIINFTNSAQMVAPLGAGQLDVAAGATAAGLYNSVGRDIDMKIVADKGSMPPGYGYMPLLVRKDLIDSGKFKSMKDMKGLKVGSQSPGGAALSTLNEALKQGGVAFKDVNLVYMGHSQLALALQNKALDAAFVTEPSATRALQNGWAVKFADGDAVYPGQQLAVVLYGGHFIKSKPDAARKVMRAYIRAARDYNDALKDGKLIGPNADEIISILVQSTSEKDAKIYKEMIANGTNPDGKVDVASIKKDYQFFKEQGLLTADVDVDKVVDNSFAEAVVKELGPYKKKQ
ncbi:MAG: transporter substrate-binding protein [Noviherbaspirillum sp.]|nr:transporter substrate-binding protein [Noviherbaspirillum sp.]